MAISVVIAQSNYLVRKALKSLIFNEKDILLEGEASTSEELVQLLKKVSPDVIIIDHQDIAFGLSTYRRVLSIATECSLLTISDKPNRYQLADALNAGITSYLLRDCEEDEIKEAIHATAAKTQFFCGKIVRDVLKTGGEQDEVIASCEGIRVSEREAEIIRFVAEGLTNKEIADKIHLSTHTVTTHRKNIMAKLGVNNTAGLVMFAIRNNIISPNHFLFNTN